MRTLIVTGGIGSGKSLVCRHLDSLGIPVYDADSKARDLYGRYPEILDGIEEEFGTVLRNEDGSLDRKKLAGIVFADNEKLLRLESIVHPFLFRDFVEWRESYEGKADLVVMESAIFMDKALFRPLGDCVILLEASEEKRLERVCQRDDCTREEALSRMKIQKFDRERADYVVVNDSDKASLLGRIDEILKTLKK